MVAFFNQPGNHTPGNEMTFRDIGHAIAEGPVLVGSPQSFSLPTMLPHEQQLEMLERLSAAVIEAARRPPRQA